METKLYSQIVRTKVDTPMKKGKAKIVDVIAKETKGGWAGGEVKIETGLIGKEAKFFETKDLKNVGGDGNIKLKKPMDQGELTPSERNEVYLGHLDGRKVENSEGEELGRIYDYEILIETTPWKIWKMLVNPTGLSPLKRRVRIHTKYVDTITSDKIILKEEFEGV